MTHEPTFDCNDVHCYSCNEDEDGPAYIICGECGHRYRTAGQLRRAYRRQMYRISREPTYPTMPPLPPEFCYSPEEYQAIDAGPVALWRVLWGLVRIRVRHIYFCQHCTHDF